MAQRQACWVWGAGRRGQLGLGAQDECKVPALVGGEKPEEAAEVPLQWHGLQNAGPPVEVDDLIPRERQDWFDDDITHKKLADRNPGRTRGAWPLEVADEKLSGSRGVFVAVGVAHTALVTADGSLWTFGAGEDGQLGHYNFESRRHPTMICVSQSSPLVPAIESPKKFTSQDTVAPNFSPPAPIQAPGLGRARVVMVACGEAHSAAVTALGGLWVWGRGSDGQLGLSSVQRLNVPTLVDPRLLAGGRAAMVACGTSYTACVTGNGHLWTWGGFFG